VLQTSKIILKMAKTKASSTKSSAKTVFFASITLDSTKDIDIGSLTWSIEMRKELAEQLKVAKTHGHGQDAGTFNPSGYERICSGLDKKFSIRKNKNWNNSYLISKVKTKVAEMVFLLSYYEQKRLHAKALYLLDLSGEPFGWNADTEVLEENRAGAFAEYLKV
jgi:hypothetical protein